MRRICLIGTGHWSRIRGGAQYQVSCLADELAGRADVSVVYLARNIDPSFSPGGYRLYQLAGKTGSSYGRLSIFTDPVGLWRSLKRHAPHVIYQRALRSYTAVAAIYAHRNRCRMYFHASSDADLTPIAKRAIFGRNIQQIERLAGQWGLRRAHGVVLQTEDQSRLLQAAYERRPTAVIRNFHPYPSELIDKSDQIIVVWVGNLKAVKQPEMYVRLAEELADVGRAEFIMVGRPGPASRYGELYGDMERLRNFRYTGELSIEDVNALLARAHILVNTSAVEGFPNTFIQAWMRRVPVVTLTVNPDGLFDERRIGVCGGDFAGMKHAVAGLMENHELRGAMGRNAEAYALENHSMDNAAALADMLINAASNGQ